MSILACASSAPTKTGIRAVFAGVEGVGKTTLACGAPRALLVPLEQGHAGIHVNKVPMLEHFNHVLQLMDECIAACQAGTFVYQSLVFDSATALERLIHNAILAMDPLYVDGNKKGLIMDNALGGYGKAYNRSNDLFGDFLKKADILVEHHGINIVMTCHVFAGKVVDPAHGEYDTWDILLHSPKNQKTYGKREMLTQWADVIGFLHEPLYVTEGKTMNKGVSANQGRVLALNRTPGWVAKNRFKVVNPIALPAEGGWNHFANAIYQASGFDCFNRD